MGTEVHVVSSLQFLRHTKLCKCVTVTRSQTHRHHNPPPPPTHTHTEEEKPVIAAIQMTTLGVRSTRQCTPSLETTHHSLLGLLEVTQVLVCDVFFPLLVNLIPIKVPPCKRRATGKVAIATEGFQRRGGAICKTLLLQYNHVELLRSTPLLKLPGTLYASRALCTLLACRSHTQRGPCTRPRVTILTPSYTVPSGPVNGCNNKKGKETYQDFRF